MAVVNAIAGVELIGQTAGEVWHLLREQGPLPITKLIQEIDAPRDLVLQALGWLAREDKIAIEEVSRRKMISLRD